MEWDRGPQGLGVLALLSLGFGVIAHVIAAPSTTSWAGVIAAAAYFVLGLVISEVWFGWATEEELQPNIDGLSFDEVLLGIVPATALVLIARHLGTEASVAAAWVPHRGSTRLRLAASRGRPLKLVRCRACAC